MALLCVASCSSSSDNTGGAAANLTIVYGNGQTGAVAMQLTAPITVQVTDVNGTPVSGTVVTFVPSADATVAHGSVLTDASGNASTTVVLGDAVGPDTVTAAVAGVAGSAVFAFTAEAGAPASLTIVSGNGQVGLLGVTLPAALVARVVDQFDNPVAGAAVDWATSAGTLIGSAQQHSAADGTVSIALHLPATAATVTVAATLHGTTTGTNFSEIATDGIATTLIVFSGDQQSGPAGTTLSSPLTVRLTDQHGNPVPGATIDWTTDSGTFVGNASTTTDNDGTASVELQLPTTADAITVTATVHGTTITHTFTATAT
jgi:adhesin/invasin